MSDFVPPQSLLIACEKCGGLRVYSEAPHGTHWVKRGERTVLVDCRGDEVKA